LNSSEHATFGRIHGSDFHPQSSGDISGGDTTHGRQPECLPSRRIDFAPHDARRVAECPAFPVSDSFIDGLIRANLSDLFGGIAASDGPIATHEISKHLQTDAMCGAPQPGAKRAGPIARSPPCDFLVDEYQDLLYDIPSIGILQPPTSRVLKNGLLVNLNEFGPGREIFGL
jgi:hypothetical protein